MDGVRFRSFTGRAEVDCDKGTSRYVSATFFKEPNFSGQVVDQLNYGKDRIRPVAFRMFRGDYAERLINAACTIASVEQAG